MWGEEGGDPQYITVLACMCVGRRGGPTVSHSASVMCVGGGGRGPTVHHSASVYVCGEEGGDPQ